MTKKTKITEQGQPCRKCGSPVNKITPLRKGRGKYYYKWYLKCPKCFTVYLVESQKVLN